jgi:NAD(P)-dependent dehydrogenase (short-subunit alcohol dehydrogenase family)
MEQGRLAGRVALITGASRGIGRAVAARYAREGAELILLARTVGGLEEVDDLVRKESGCDRGALLIPLDLAHGEALDALAPALHERFQRLDILVANAGSFHALSPLAHIEPKDWEEDFAVNVTAPWRLVRALDPLLRQSEAGRAIFVTTGATLAPRAYWGSYAISKSALEMMVGIYAQELAITKARANLIDPGRVRTAMRARAYPGEDPSTVPAPEDITEAFVYLAEAACIANGERFHVRDFSALPA